jgi:hypothetical protein
MRSAQQLLGIIGELLIMLVTVGAGCAGQGN